MANRRIRAIDSLAPVQELSVEPHSSYHSTNVTKLTRTLTGEKKKQLVSRGLGVQGIPDILTADEFGTTAVNGRYDYYPEKFTRNSQRAYIFERSGTDYAISYTGTRWVLTSCTITGSSPSRTISYSATVIYQESLTETEPNGTWLVGTGSDPGNVNYGAEEVGATLIDEDFTTDPSLSGDWETLDGFVWDAAGYIKAQKSVAAATGHIFEIESQDDTSESDYYIWYKISFDVTNVTSAVSGVGNPLYIHSYYGGVLKSWTFPTDGHYYYYMQAENNSYFKLQVVMNPDSPYTPDETRIDNIKVEQLDIKSGLIDPITDITVNRQCISATLLRPHERCQINSGVCIQDDVMINLLGENAIPSDNITTLEYANSDCWIKANPYVDADFYDPDKTYLEDDNTDSDKVYHCTQDDIPVRSSEGRDFIFAYIAVYYTNYQNQIPNKAYLGLVREEDIIDPLYSDDYLILAVVRLVRPDTADAIFYYPERPDRLWDADQISYLNLGDLTHWQYRPTNITQALDILAQRDVEQGHIFIFDNYVEFCTWYHNPYLRYNWPDEDGQEKPGRNPHIDYDSLIYIVEDASWWRTPTNPLKSGGDLADGWGNNGWALWDSDVSLGEASSSSGGYTCNDAIKEHVPTVFKPVLAEFEIRWGVKEEDWSSLNTGQYTWAAISYDESTGSLTYDATDLSLPVLVDANDIEEVRGYFPTYAFVAPHSGYSANGGVRFVNPFNPLGNGLVPGSTPNDIQDNKFLRADGKWEHASPTGSVVMWSGDITTPPDGWLVCDGSSLNSVTNIEYANLYSVIGTTFGGTGNTDFDIPDMTDRFVLGASNPASAGLNIGDTGGNTNHLKQLSTDEIPEHTHGITGTGSILTATDGGHSHPYFDSSHSATDGEAMAGTTQAVITDHSSNSTWRDTGNPDGTDSGTHSHSITASTIAGALNTTVNVTAEDSFDVRPQYLVLGFIIKI